MATMFYRIRVNRELFFLLDCQVLSSLTDGIMCALKSFGSASSLIYLRVSLRHVTLIGIWCSTVGRQDRRLDFKTSRFLWMVFADADILNLAATLLLAGPGRIYR